VQGRSESRQHVIAHRRGGREARLAWSGIREHGASLGHEIRGPAGTGHVGVSMTSGQQAQGAGMGRGEEPSLAITAMFLCQYGRLLANIRSVYSYTRIFIYFTFISIYLFSCQTHVRYLNFHMLDIIIGRHTSILLLSQYWERVAKYAHTYI